MMKFDDASKVLLDRLAPKIAESIKESNQFYYITKASKYPQAGYGPLVSSDEPMKPGVEYGYVTISDFIVGSKHEMMEHLREALKHSGISRITGEYRNPHDRTTTYYGPLTAEAVMRKLNKEKAEAIAKAFEEDRPKPNNLGRYVKLTPRG